MASRTDRCDSWNVPRLTVDYVLPEDRDKPASEQLVFSIGTMALERQVREAVSRLGIPANVARNALLKVQAIAAAEDVSCADLIADGRHSFSGTEQAVAMELR